MQEEHNYSLRPPRASPRRSYFSSSMILILPHFTEKIQSCIVGILGVIRIYDMAIGGGCGMADLLLSLRIIDKTRVRTN